MHILVVDDHVKLAMIVKQNLEKYGFVVDACFDGLEALKLIKSYNYDVAILDLLMPDMHGFKILQKLKKISPRTKTIIISSLKSIDDRVTGLHSGADDYLCKEFAIEELAARIHTVSRRQGIPKNRDVYRHKGYLFDVSSSTIKYKQQTINLTINEALIMKELFKSINTPVSYKILINTMKLKGSIGIVLNTLNVNISNIRRKIKSISGPELIQTIRKKGYMLKK